MKRLRYLAASSLLASALLFAAPVLAAPQTYEIDPVHSRVEFTIRHMFTRVTGSFGGFHGTIQYDAAAPASSTVNAEIDAGTIDTGNDKRDGHLKSPDFFDVAKFPTLTFISSKVTPGEGGKLKVAGTLTMHGVTRPVELDAAFLGSGPGRDAPRGRRADQPRDRSGRVQAGGREDRDKEGRQGREERDREKREVIEVRRPWRSGPGRGREGPGDLPQQRGDRGAAPERSSAARRIEGAWAFHEADRRNESRG